MSKNFCFLLIVIILISSCRQVMPMENSAPTSYLMIQEQPMASSGDALKDFGNGLGAIGKSIAGYIYSKNGLKDISAAYCITMANTGAHELGESLMLKTIYGRPLDITLGRGYPSSIDEWNKKPMAQLGGFKLGGLNPIKAYSSSTGCCIPFAGPIAGVAFSVFIFKLLQKYTNSPYIFTKAALLHDFSCYTMELTATLMFYLACIIK